MTLPRTLALAAATLATVATAAALAPPPPTPPPPPRRDDRARRPPAKSWGTYYAPRRAAKAWGTLTATGEDHADLPTADSVRITGKVYDNTRRSSCGWAVLRITYRSGNELPFRERWVRDCSYGSPKHFSLRYRDVYQVELKVCSEPKAKKPSLTCLYAGTWKTLYLSK
ncbi:hypothetical protein [Nonomuraea salmonea]|uniref:hypothetical protein n=1 Tax=Nonomuraea salmonea TaxID=46181 RepID=UPI002FE94866